jgi:tetratricopeptide (TPR) repeat protein
MLADLERRPEAIATFSKLLALQPKNLEALKERAENFINEAELDKALADLTRAKALAPSDPWVYHKTGMALFCQNRYEEAVEAFSTAIRLSPETPLFYFSRGELYLRHLDSRDKALADFDKGCSLGHPLCCHELEGLKAQGQTSEPGK